ncbi:hypothetical protein [Halococcus sp. PRR34]|uniref:hypothetical protein n=1 Tax=Halococcus sp. PRR34 TaxID=3020830 RepID=UPI002360ABA5|nr:hypothetical protein [Halococcus sp. PRR34]
MPDVLEPPNPSPHCFPFTEIHPDLLDPASVSASVRSSIRTEIHPDLLDLVVVGVIERVDIAGSFGVVPCSEFPFACRELFELFVELVRRQAFETATLSPFEVGFVAPVRRRTVPD